jgi:hypothetical protein
LEKANNWENYFSSMQPTNRKEKKQIGDLQWKSFFMSIAERGG